MTSLFGAAMKYIAMFAVILLLAACAAVTEQVIVIVTATPNPNEIVIRMTHTPANNPPAEVTTIPQTPTSIGVQAATATAPIDELFPEPIAKVVFIAEQEFERAHFFWLEPAERTQSIWVLLYDENTTTQGRWMIYEDTFEEGELSLDPNILPPEGFQQPIRGFGKLWRKDEKLRDDVGWALDREFGYSAEYRYEFGGEVVDGEYIAAPGVHFITNRFSLTYRFDESDFTWSVIEN